MDIYVRELSELEPLSPEEEARLAKQIKQGDRAARNKLVEANLRFVVSVAKEYGVEGLTFEDLVSAGNLGIVLAAERFDETRGVKFITYAVWWIRQSIRSAISQESRTVRLPDSQRKRLKLIREAYNKLSQIEATQPDFSSLAEEAGLPLEAVWEALLSSQQLESLDSPLVTQEHHTRISLVPSLEFLAPDSDLIENSSRVQIQKVLDTLEERQAQVLRLHFGFAGTEPMTLADIGRQLGLSKERVRQIKEGALEKLRHPKRRSQLLATL